jgi:hypothetical protein
MSDDYLTRCNWCTGDQNGNLTDICTNCKAEGYLMDYKGEGE